MEPGPHPLAERIVARLLPRPCREHVLGDLYERNAATGPYVWDALRSVPYAVWGQVRRTTSPGFACLQGGAVYAGFLSAYGRVAPGVLPTTTDGVLGTLAPALAAVVVLALRDAWTGGRRRVGVRALVDVPLGVAIACAAHVVVQAFRPHAPVGPMVTMVAGAVSLLLLSIVRVSDARANTPTTSVQSGGSDMQVLHSEGSPARRSRRWLLALVPLGAAVGLGASYFSPPIYRAEVSVLLLPAAVPTHVMPVDLKPHLDARLTVASMQVLSGERLDVLIRDVGLYGRNRPVTEDTIARMRQDISLTIVASGERGAWFTVAYHAADPMIAMRVVERLASLVVQENLGHAEPSLGPTDPALQVRLEDMGQRLAAVSAELDQARRGAAGSRPVAVLDIEHQVIRDQYRSLYERAQVAGTGRPAIGEQFRILEPARLPDRPVGPVRLLWTGLGAAAGLIAACATLLIRSWPQPPRARPEAATLPA